MKNERKMTYPNRTLEEILQHFFGCKKPFRTDGELTCKGSAAYGNLVELLYNLSNLTEIDVNDMVETLDNIIDNQF